MCMAVSSLSSKNKKFVFPLEVEANAVVTVSDIERIINNAMTGLNNRLDIMSESISDIKSDIGNLTSNVHEIVDDLGILRNTVGDTVQRVDDLTERITNIEGNLQDLTNNISTNVDNFSQINKYAIEIEERIKRKCNLILFGLFESRATTIDKDDINDDKKNVLNFISTFFDSSTITDIKTYRIGNFKQDHQRPRPLKIVLSNYTVAKSLHRKFMSAKKAARDNLMKGMSLHPDKTKYQLEEVTSLKKQLDLRISQGEKNLCLTFRHGTPAITKRTLPVVADLSTTSTSHVVN